MAAYQKFNSFVEAVAEGKHNLATDVLKVALSNAANAPSASLDAVLADITTVSVANLDSVTLTTSSSSQTGGTYSLVLADKVMTATGAVGPFRYAIVYDDTALNDELISFFDYASEITMAAGETFTLNFGASLFTLA